MGTDRCIVNPESDCLGIERADKFAMDISILANKFYDFQQSVADTNNRFGARIGALESHNHVQDEKLQQIKEAQLEIKNGIREAQIEEKQAISELRKEHKESMVELKNSNKEILDALIPLKQKVDEVEQLKQTVEEIKARPGKTWETIKDKGLNWAILLVLGIIAAALGLSKYL